MPNLNYHIAFFTNNYAPFVGGVPLSVELYMRYLTELGNRVLVYAPEYDEATEDGEEVRRLPAILHFNNTDFSLPLPISFKPVLDFSAEAFDIVHVHHPFLLGEMGMRIARQHRLPLVFTYHTQYEQYTHYVPLSAELSSETIIRHAVEFCNLCDLVIAPTHDIQRLLRQREVETRIEVLPTGVELKRFEDGDPEAVRRELELDRDQPLLVHVGRLAHEKNLEFLLNACLLALKQNRRMHLAIAGEGKSADALREQIEAAGEPGTRVHFLGSRRGRDLVNVYRAADLFVFASKTETQGMVIAEALAAGTPTIALDADGVRDLVRDGTNGRMLPEDIDTAGFAGAILEAVNNRELLKQWRQGARQTAEALDMPALATRLHQIYQSLKLLPNHQLKSETMSFGLIRNYFETVWEHLENWFASI